jgi:regulatory protein
MTAPAKGRSRPRGPRAVTPARLEAKALAYVGRFGGTAASLRRVLANMVSRAARVHDMDMDEAAAWIDALVVRYADAGLVDDDAFAAGRARRLHRRGVSARRIRANLASKGVAPEQASAAVERLVEETPEPEMAAAIVHARRRRLGPYREAAGREDNRRRDLGVLARAGFAFDIARRVIDAASPEDLEEEDV